MRRPPRPTQSRSSAASDVYKRQGPSTSVGGDSISHVYGYWYNYDENGEKNFVIHLLGNQDADGTVRPTDVDGGADADVFIFDTDHGAYLSLIHISEPTRLGMISYAVFCLKKKNAVICLKKKKRE